MSVDKEVNNYIDFFSKMLDSIKELSTSDKEHISLFKQILSLTIIDTLAGCRYPSEICQSVRFRNFIINYADWNECEKVSLPQLYMHLLKSCSSKSSYLLKYVENELSKWGDEDTPIYKDADQSILEEIKEQKNTKSSTVKISKQKEDKELAKFKHINLIRNYRNVIIHQGRKSGYGWDVSGKSTVAHYQCSGIFDGTSEITTWELVYPDAFLFKLVENCLINFKAYLINNNINPYDNHNFTSIWPEINK